MRELFAGNLGGGAAAGYRQGGRRKIDEGVFDEFRLLALSNSDNASAEGGGVTVKDVALCIRHAGVVPPPECSAVQRSGKGGCTTVPPIITANLRGHARQASP